MLQWITGITLLIAAALEGRMTLLDPDIAVEGGVGRYEYSSAVWGATTATYWSGGLGLDFSKFLWSETKLKPAKKSGLPVAKLLYRYYSEADHSGISTTPLNSHFVGMMLRASL
jgi:hypothetical protein